MSQIQRLDSLKPIRCLPSSTINVSFISQRHWLASLSRLDPTSTQSRLLVICLTSRYGMTTTTPLCTLAWSPNLGQAARSGWTRASTTEPRRTRLLREFVYLLHTRVLMKNKENSTKFRSILTNNLKSNLQKLCFQNRLEDF